MLSLHYLMYIITSNPVESGNFLFFNQNMAGDSAEKKKMDFFCWISNLEQEKHFYAIFGKCLTQDHKSDTKKGL